MTMKTMLKNAEQKYNFCKKRSPIFCFAQLPQDLQEQFSKTKHRTLMRTTVYQI